MSQTPVLQTLMVEKVWGRDSLPSPFVAPEGQRIGEIWFEPPAAFDKLLVKYLFTSEKLSVQVHPGAEQARASGAGQSGKDECWLVLDADEGATLGVGFKQAVTKDEIRAAALDGSIEGMIEWYPVKRGDFFYIPAGTIHAIGPGVSLVEVQQNTPVTYRLYDYGRPRELHLDAGLQAVSATPHPAHLRRHVPPSGAQSLVDGPFFMLDRSEGMPGSEVARRYRGPLLALPIDGEVRVAGAVVAAGQCALAPSIEDLSVPDGVAVLLACPTN